MKPNLHIRAAAGFTLVEVAIAIGLSVVALTTLMGLLPVGMRAGQNSTSLTSATNLLTGVSTELRSIKTGAATATPTSLLGFVNLATDGTSSQNPVTIYLADDGRVAAAGASDVRFRLTLWINTPAATAVGAATLVRARISWPANVATLDRAIGSVETLISLDRN